MSVAPEQMMTDKNDHSAEEQAQEIDAKTPTEKSAEQASAEEKAETPRTPLEEAREQIDALQRQAAELDNRRKRLERLTADQSRYALQDLAGELLPVIDNFERALDHADEARDVKALHDGLLLVHDQLLSVLKKFNISKIETLGKPFDPNHHEALGQIDSPDHPDQTVIDVHEEGYMLHDRLIRPSRVIVSRQPRDDAPDEAADAEPSPADNEAGE